MHRNNKIVETSINYAPITSPQIVLSIPDGADVIIGQNCYITITVTDKTNPDAISFINSISIEPDNPNDITVCLIKDWKKSHQTSGEATFILQMNTSLTDGQPVGYKIILLDLHGKALSGVQPQPVKYTAKSLDPNTVIQLKAQPEFVDMPTKDNSVGKPGSIYSTFSGVISADDKTPLKHTQVVITTEITGQLSKILPLVNIAKDESSAELIPIESEVQSEFFIIKSDEKGYISFRVYPIKNTPVRIDFKTQILGLTDAIFVESIYIFNSEPPPIFGLWSPIILGLAPGGILKQSFGTKVFRVKLESYLNYQTTDAIVFYKRSALTRKIERLEPVFKARDINTLSKYRFVFPYDKLKINEATGLYYMVIPQEGKPRYSTTTGVTYIGGQDDSPTDDIDRIYDKPKIYSSYATQNTIDPSKYDDEVSEYGAVTLDTIEQQKIQNEKLIPRPKKIQDIHGLYVVVQGTKKPNDPNSGSTLPLLGAQPFTGKVGIYLTSRTRTSHNHYTFQLPDLTASKDFTVVPIPFCALNRAAGYHSGAEGTLYIEYTIDDGNGTLTYSKVWQVDLNTIALGQEPDDRDGCPRETNN